MIYLQSQRKLQQLLIASRSVAIELCICGIPLDCLIVKFDSTWEVTWRVSCDTHVTDIAIQKYLSQHTTHKFLLSNK